jgi:dipeptidyl aminopeptidase/acylaminoacyl peptidase
VDPPSLVSIGATDDDIIFTRREKDIWVARSRNLVSGATTVIDGDGSGGLLGDPITGRLNAQVFERLEGREHRFTRPEDQKLWQAIVKAWPQDSVDFLDWSADRNIVVVGVEGRGSGAGVYVVDRKARTAQRLIDDLPGSVPADFAEQRPVRFIARDGLEIPAYLTLPNGRPAKQLPLVLLVDDDRARRGIDSDAQALASLGYAVFQPQLRGMAGYSPAFTAAKPAERLTAGVDDIADGVRWLAKAGTIDPERVCVIGTSMSAAAAFLAAPKLENNFRCVAGVFGAYDLRKFMKLLQNMAGPAHDSVAYQRLREKLGVTGPEDPKLEALSPITYVSQIKAPVLLINLKNDPVQADVMADAFKRQGRPVERHAVLLDDWRESNEGRVDLIEALAEFIKRHNPPDL